MYLVSWNVNGLRSVLQKGELQRFLQWAEPEVLALQEVRAEPDQVDAELAAYPHKIWHPGDKKGYSGTAVFSQHPPIQVQRGLGVPQLEGEGRMISVEMVDFHLVTIYAPNSRRDLSRLPFRQEWDLALAEHLYRLQREKPVVLCGDFNVAYQPLDLARPRRNEGKHGFTSEERAGFETLLSVGLVDVFRKDHPEEPGHYTWWSFRPGDRARNLGWRLDYFLVSEPLVEHVAEATIHREIEGSDHCPIGLRLRSPE